MKFPKIKKLKLPSIPFDEIARYIKERKLKEVAQKIDEAYKRFNAVEFTQRSSKVHQLSKDIFLLNNEKSKFIKMIDDIDDENYRNLAKEELVSTIKRCFDDPLDEMRKHKKKHSQPRR